LLTSPLDAGRVDGTADLKSNLHGGTMATAREIMSGGAECVGENETLEAAARKMSELDVGALPICGEDDRLKGMLTDRDIVVKAIAVGKSPADTKAGELGDGKPVTIGADDSTEEVLRTMTEHQVRRLPVIDGHDLIGVISQADIAKNLSDEETGSLVEAISSAAAGGVPSRSGLSLLTARPITRQCRPGVPAPRTPRHRRAKVRRGH
jgi:CBS domain-containing protein